MSFLEIIKKWLEVVPSKDDLFGVNIRTTFQSLMKLRTNKCQQEKK